MAYGLRDYRSFLAREDTEPSSKWEQRVAGGTKAAAGKWRACRDTARAVIFQGWLPSVLFLQARPLKGSCDLPTVIKHTGLWRTFHIHIKAANKADCWTHEQYSNFCSFPSSLDALL